MRIRFRIFTFVETDDTNELTLGEKPFVMGFYVKYDDKREHNTFLKILKCFKKIDSSRI